MSTSSRRRFRAAPRTTLNTTPVTFTLASVPLSEPEIVNSGRGQYEWLGIPADPSWWPVIDVYERDQMKWPLLEPAQGVYDMAVFERGLSKAVNMGGRYIFRIQTWLPDHPSHDFVPAWVPVLNDGYYTPDWNSEAFLSGWENLMAALGTYAADDPRLFAVDYGGYGSCGEWLSWTNADKGANDYIGTPITLGNAQRMMRAVNSAFPGKPKLINWTGGPYGGWPEIACALGDPKVAIRTDYVGCMDMPYICTTTEAQTAWQRAPMMGEWGNNAATCSMTMALKNINDFHMSLLSSGNHPVLYDNMPTADKQAYEQVNKTLGFRYSVTSLQLMTGVRADTNMPVQTTWLNSTIAPTYDAWQILLVLKNTSGEWRLPLEGDLRSLYGGSATTTFTSTVSLPASIPAGEYTVAIMVVDEAGFLPPLRLATPGRTAQGMYPMGSITIQAAAGGTPAHDTLPPATPVITSSSSTTTTPYVATGTAEAGCSITVRVNGRPFTTTADIGGAWSVILKNVSAIGQIYAASATATDTFGNASAAATWHIAVTGTVLVADSFNRANGGLGTADSGQSWTIAAGGWSVSSNTAIPSSGDVAAMIPIGQSDMLASADITSIAANAWIGLAAAYIDSNNYYSVETNGASGTLNLIRKSAGTVNVLATPPATNLRNLGIRVKSFSTGTSLYVYADGILIHQYFDMSATRPNGTKAGMICGNYATSAPTYDSFKVVAG